jgi:hypothetical protein
MSSERMMGSNAFSPGNSTNLSCPLLTTAPHIQPVSPVAVSTITPVVSQSDNAGDQNANENMASGVSAGKLGLSPVYSDC